MSSFNPKPFPPPSLSDVPVEYIIDQLHSLASQFWDKPETADCTIIVPIPHAQNNSFQTQFPAEPSKSVSISFENSGGGNRRATQPPLNAAPRISLELHMDYLSAHSIYLRGLFSGSLALDLISPNHPILFLPLPDPSSFYLLVHWMYFGDLSIIADCLHRGAIQWEGIARNVEYLGLPADIKLFLSKWYSTWLDTEASRAVEQEQMADEDSDTAYSDSDDDDRMSSSTASDLEEELSDLENLKEPSSRGRDQIVRPLSFQSFVAPQT
ncbi:hypothetical protein H1R20_g9354, partial [Candolleomyces eurysporus]